MTENKASLTLIQAMKQRKLLLADIEELKAKINAHAADLDNEAPVYTDEVTQRKTVEGWLQAIHDKLSKIEELSLRIQKTNLETKVTIEIEPSRTVEKTIAAWVLRRRDLANHEQLAWGLLNDRNLKDKTVPTSTGGSATVKVRRYFDPQVRDQKVTNFRREPHLIDSILETVNATTPLLEL